MSLVDQYISHKWEDDQGIQMTRSLQQHLIEVGISVKENLEKFHNADQNFIKAGIIAGTFHDFGKFTTYFQNYIKEGENSQYKEHAFISALFGAFYSYKLNLDNEYQYMVFASILHHHGDLCNIDEDIGKTKIIETKLFSPNQNLNKRINIILRKQIADLGDNKDKINRTLLLIIDVFKKIFGTEDSFLTEFIDTGYFKIFNILVDYRSEFRRSQKDNSLSLKLLYLFSSLIDSDKFSAAGIKRERIVQIEPEIVDLFRYQKFDIRNQSPIDKMRNELYEQIKHSVSNSSLDNHIFTITAPTGSGKTIASIEAALQLSKKVREKYGKVTRIIYSMPFVTLLEQNFKIAEDIISAAPGFNDNPQNFIISHHHLSDPTYVKDGEVLPVEKSLLLIESWDSFFIVTTFVQLFESMLSNKNKKLKKIHNLVNSIIIIDEIQSIKVELWPTIRDILKKFSKEFNIYFIIMSATLPEIYSDAIELSGTREQIQKRFEDLNRVNLNINITPCSIEDVINNKSYYFGSKSILFVFNTIRSSLDAFIYLKDHFVKNELVIPAYYISGNLTPRDRSNILKEIIQDLDNGRKPIVVGTQLFEAGVDIDFDVVVRDLSPIDSIIQSSGRANRNGKHSNGEVFVVDISKNHKFQGYYSKLVYGKIHTEISIDILTKYNGSVVREAKFIELITNYYQILKDRYQEDKSIFINALNNLMYGNGVKESHENFSSDFRIIGGYKECSIFIEEDEEATSILSKFREVQKLTNTISKKNEFIKIRKDFYKFIINLDMEKIKAYDLTLQNEGNIYIMYGEVAKNQYNHEIGLVNNSSEGLVI